MTKLRALLAAITAAAISAVPAVQTAAAESAGSPAAYAAANSVSFTDTVISVFTEGGISTVTFAENGAWRFAVLEETYSPLNLMKASNRVNISFTYTDTDQELPLIETVDSFSFTPQTCAVMQQAVFTDTIYSVWNAQNGMTIISFCSIGDWECRELPAEFSGFSAGDKVTVDLNYSVYYNGMMRRIERVNSVQLEESGVPLNNGSVMIDLINQDASFTDTVVTVEWYESGGGNITFANTGKWSVPEVYPGRWPDRGDIPDSQNPLMLVPGDVVDIDLNYTSLYQGAVPRINTVDSIEVIEHGEGSTMSGDANGDFRVNIADAVSVLQYLANSDKYPMSEQGIINADVDGDPGITGADAVKLQMIDAKAEA